MYKGKYYDLTGIDGNAFSVMAYVKRAMREQGFSEKERNEYQKKCTSGNYDDLLSESCEIIDKCNERSGASCHEDDCDDYE
jgi:hypothetical protein